VELELNTSVIAVQLSYANCLLVTHDGISEQIQSFSAPRRMRIHQELFYNCGRHLHMLEGDIPKEWKNEKIRSQHNTKA
jgi:hypothetical protein